MKKLMLGAVAAVFFAACGTGDGGSGGGAGQPAPDELSVQVEDMEETKGFITAIDGERVLVNQVFYTIDEETHLVGIGDGAERELSIEDLELGMRADVYHSGMLAESFPAQGHATVFAVPKDGQSLSQTEAFQAFIEAEGDDFVILGKPEIGSETIRFDFTMVTGNESYTVELDVESHDYTLEPKQD
ncbi:hypothetical protein M3557_12235 [Bhargavaea ginsengi]|uniref:hypothetical protein n=1 Tax=Bhargavaea ginsengi TaxID=426757 RepID=UPI002040AFE6|nr:hypothetical protein [Bhargavaea ginsengi]MCM3088691.1 hypothetical protein [Bhargavaea ginsengi]